jgi:hypothetical protein
MAWSLSSVPMLKRCCFSYSDEMHIPSTPPHTLLLNIISWMQSLLKDLHNTKFPLQSSQRQLALNDLHVTLKHIAVQLCFYFSSETIPMSLEAAQLCSTSSCLQAAFFSKRQSAASPVRLWLLDAAHQLHPPVILGPLAAVPARRLGSSSVTCRAQIIQH